MKKLFLGSMACSMMLPLSMVNAFAADQNVGEGTTEVPITADLTSGFTVTIPKTIDISTGTANYTVGVLGDINSNEKITVVPDNSFNLADVNTKKDNLSTTVTQTKQEWNWDEIKTQATTNGSMAVTGLSAGDWTGKANFNVNLNSKVEMKEMVTGSKFNDILSELIPSISNRSYINAVSSISFIDTKAPDDAYLKDVSSAQDGGVVMWKVGFNAYVSTQEAGVKIAGNEDCNEMFVSSISESSKLKTINFDNFDTRNVTNMEKMFFGNSSLTSLDLSNFDTSNVINMKGMFGFYINLTTLNISNWDTSNVTKMSLMFDSCQDLTSELTVKNPNVANYHYMFGNCATVAPAKVTVNYTAETSDLVDQMIAEKSPESNVVKGKLVE